MIEVSESATRRNFTKEYKLALLEKADQCREPGPLGQLMRQEDLYSSHLSTWREQRRSGALKALGRKRGPKSKKHPPQSELDKLQCENERLR